MRSFVPNLGRAIWVLLGGVLFTHLGSYMLLPFLAIFLSQEKGLSLGNVGLVLGAGSIAYLSGSLVGGFLSDRLGRKLTMVSGLLIRGVGLLGFIYFDTFTSLVVTNLIAGVGGGLYMPPAKAGIASLASQDTKTTAFSYRGIAANIGVTLGPLLGTFLLTRSYVVLFWGAAIVYFGLALSHVLLLSKDCTTGIDCPKVEKGSVREIFAHRSFLVFSFVTVFVWALFTQFTLSLPLRATQIEATQNIALIWTTTSVLVILLQSPLSRWFSKAMHPLQAMSLGTIILGIALGTVAFSTTFWHLILSAVLFTIGEMFIMPTADAIVSDLANPKRMGSYFGVSAFVFGAGESLGNIGGGQLMEAAVRQDTLALPWIVFAVTGVLVGVAYYGLTFWQALAKPLTPMVEERVGAPSVMDLTDSKGDSRVGLRRKGKV